MYGFQLTKVRFSVVNQVSGAHQRRAQEKSQQYLRSRGRDHRPACARHRVHHRVFVGGWHAELEQLVETGITYRPVVLRHRAVVIEMLTESRADSACAASPPVS